MNELIESLEAVAESLNEAIELQGERKIKWENARDAAWALLRRLETMNELIKQTGMKLEPLAALLGIPYWTLRAYAAGKRTMPEDVEKKLKELIARLKG